MLLLSAFASLALGCHQGNYRHSAEYQLESSIPRTVVASSQMPRSARGWDTPAYYSPTPGIDRSVVAASNAQISDDELVAAWDVFRDPRLRWVHELSLRNSPDVDTIQQRFLDLRLPEPVTVPNDLTEARHFYMIELARRVCNARLQEHRLRTLDQQLERQRDALHQARIRSEVGSATKADLVQLVSRAQQTEAMFPMEFQKRDLIVAEMEALIGQPMTQALVEALGDQPALSLEQVKNSIPAKRLQARCDVDTAAQSVKRFATSAGIAEAELLPQLALRGSIRIDEPSQERSRDQRGLQLGDLNEWSFSAPSDALGRSGISGSPFQQAINGYQQTVTNAATEVKQLLSDYIALRNRVRRTADTLAAAEESLRRTRAQFEVDRASAGDVVDAQTRVLEVDLQLHDADYELALAAIDLFVALGGPCKTDRVRWVGFYDG